MDGFWFSQSFVKFRGTGQSQLLLCKHLCINASVSEMGRCQLLGVGILFSACTVVCSVGEMMAHMKQSSS